MAVDSISKCNSTYTSTNNTTTVRQFIKKQADNLLFPQKIKKNNEYTCRFSRNERIEQLQNKEERTNSFWNKCKNYFGFGETMSDIEKDELNNLIKEERSTMSLKVDDNELQ